MASAPTRSLRTSTIAATKCTLSALSQTTLVVPTEPKTALARSSPSPSPSASPAVKRGSSSVLSHFTQVKRRADAPKKRRLDQISTSRRRVPASDSESDCSDCDCASDADTIERKTPEEPPVCIVTAAQAALHTGTLPKEIPCRAAHLAKVAEFLRDCATFQRGGALYVCGGPGTGKTTAVAQCLERLAQSFQPAPKMLLVNAMSVATQPSHIFTLLWRKLCCGGRQLWTDEASTIKAVQAALIPTGSAGRSANKRPMTILVVDECDALVSRNQEVLLRLFEWAATKGSLFVLVCISNSIDMLDRRLSALPPKHAPQKVIFETYSQQDVQDIIASRLNQLGDCRTASLFQQQALELCARKVAAGSGDLRKALDILRRALGNARGSCSCKTAFSDSDSVAVESVGEESTAASARGIYQALQHEGGPSVVAGAAPATRVHVPTNFCAGRWKGNLIDLLGMSALLRSTFSSKYVETMESLPRDCKVVIGIAVRLGETMKGKVPFVQLQNQVAAFCKTHGLTVLNASEFSDAIDRLASCGLLSKVAVGVGRREYRILVNIAKDDFEAALEGTTLFEEMLKKYVPPAAKRAVEDTIEW